MSTSLGLHFDRFARMSRDPKPVRAVFAPYILTIPNSVVESPELKVAGDEDGVSVHVMTMRGNTVRLDWPLVGNAPPFTSFPRTRYGWDLRAGCVVYAYIVIPRDMLIIRDLRRISRLRGAI